MLHGTGMTNLELANVIGKYEGLPPAEGAHKYEGGMTKILTVADTAEPKSIAEMKSYGINIVGAKKGADSVEHGISVVQQQHLYLTEYRVNFIKDFRNYVWKVDKSGRPLGIGNHDFSHSGDAVRYGITDILDPQTYVFRVRSA
jgi:phage terminase large subunit